MSEALVIHGAVSAGACNILGVRCAHSQALRYQAHLDKVNLANNHINVEGLEAIARALLPPEDQELTAEDVRYVTENFKLTEWDPALDRSVFVHRFASPNVRRWGTWADAQADQVTNRRAASLQAMDTKYLQKWKKMFDELDKVSFINLRSLNIMDNPQPGEHVPPTVSRLMQCCCTRNPFLLELNDVCLGGSEESSQSHELHLDDSRHLDEYEAVFIAHQLRMPAFSQLRVLNLSGNLLGMSEAERGVALRQLGHSLAVNASLEVLYLSGNDLSVDDIAEFADALFPVDGTPGNQGLSKLQSHQSLTLPLISLRAAPCQSIGPLQVLQLPFINMDDEDVTVLAAGLRMSSNYNIHLQEINLNYNNIGPAGAQELATCLAQLPHPIMKPGATRVLGHGVSTLKLSGNPLCDDGAIRLGEALRKGCWVWLDKLEMYDTRMSQEAEEDLVVAVQAANNTYGTQLKILHEENDEEFMHLISSMAKSRVKASVSLREVQKNLETCLPPIIHGLRKNTSVVIKLVALDALQSLLDCDDLSEHLFNAYMTMVINFQGHAVLKCLTMLLILDPEHGNSLWGPCLPGTHSSRQAARHSPAGESAAKMLPEQEVSKEAALQTIRSATLKSIDCLAALLEFHRPMVCDLLMRINTTPWLIDFIVVGQEHSAEVGAEVQQRMTSFLMDLVEDEKLPVLPALIANVQSMASEAVPPATPLVSMAPGRARSLNASGVGRANSSVAPTSVTHQILKVPEHLARKTVLLLMHIMEPDPTILRDETIKQLMHILVDVIHTLPADFDDSSCAEWERVELFNNVSPNLDAAINLFTCCVTTKTWALEMFLGPTFFNVAGVPLIPVDDHVLDPSMYDPAAMDVRLMLFCATVIRRLLLVEKAKSLLEPNLVAADSASATPTPQAMFYLLVENNLYAMCVRHFLYFKEVIKQDNRHLEPDACEAMGNLCHLLEVLTPSTDYIVSRVTKPMVTSMVTYLRLVYKSYALIDEQQNVANVLAPLVLVYRYRPNQIQFLMEQSLLDIILTILETIEGHHSRVHHQSDAERDAISSLVKSCGQMIEVWAEVVHPPDRTPAETESRKIRVKLGGKPPPPETVAEEIETNQMTCMRFMAGVIRFQPCPPTLERGLNSLLTALELKTKEEEYTAHSGLLLLPKCGFQNEAYCDGPQGLVINIADKVPEFMKQGGSSTYWSLASSITIFVLAGLHIQTEGMNLTSEIAKKIGMVIGKAAKDGRGPDYLYTCKPLQDEKGRPRMGADGKPIRTCMPMRALLRPRSRGVTETHVVDRSPRSPVDAIATTIHLDGEGIGWSELMILAGFLTWHTTFTTLDCKGILMDVTEDEAKEVADALIEAMEECPLNHVTLYDKPIEVGRLRCTDPDFTPDQCTEFVATSDTWHPAELALIAATAASSPLLTTFHIPGANLSSWALDYIEKLVAKSETLTSLDLTDTAIPPGGMERLGAALQENQSLLTLNLNKNIVGTRGVIQLSGLIRQHPRLRELHLEGKSCEEGLDDKEGTAVAEALEKSKCLTRLNITSSTCGPNFAKRLWQSMQTNQAKCIQRLDLGSSSLGPRGLHELAGLLEPCKGRMLRLTSLDISNNMLTGVPVGFEVKAKRQNGKTGRGELDYSGLETFMSAWKQNTTLQARAAPEL
ncbi:hypothetical protein CYMTET_35860 [Cymbomonas tetramitiformis]|uniref:Uncharacterized protein n=1 Tax=Cymbomonas tetramitiformis TaxID=36881 RepID=A0AAE0KNA0_9CHLO|nr:hypothetical protein CYMTET_35860 [Cymbomonas tetramitiformis]